MNDNDRMRFPRRGKAKLLPGLPELETRLKPLVSLLLCFAGIALGAAAVSGPTTNHGGGVTFHKGWKARQTPRNPVWGPSQCGGTKTVRSYPAGVKKSASKKAKNTKKVRDKSPVSDWEYRQSERDVLRKMKEIHLLQLDLVRRRDLSLEKREAKIGEIRKAYPTVFNPILRTKDFPFPNRLEDMGNILRGIRAKTIRSDFSADGKTDEQLLREIQDRQFKLLKASIDDAVRSRRAQGDR